MEPVLRLATWWVDIVTKAFGEHTLGAAVISIAAIGIFVVVQKEYRPFGVLTNAGIVLLGWLVAITALPFAMSGAANAVATLETTLPVASRIAGYFYGIYERHPILVLAIAGIGSTVFFLKQSWPYRLSWAPVRAACTVFAIVFLVHVSAPIADLAEPVPAPAAPKASAPMVPAKDAVAAAIKAGDLRYVAVSQCAEEVVGYPGSEQGSAPKAAVKRFGLSCGDTLGSEGIAKTYANREYAAEYNRLMYEHNKAAEAKPVVSENKAETKQ
jgi:hypothetical protein